MNQTLKIVIVSSIVGAIVSSSISFAVQNLQKRTSNDLIKEFYEIENAVHVSPHGLRKKMSKGKVSDYVLVDLRSPQEYEKEHVVTAINIPAYKNPNTSAYDEKDRIVKAFKALPKNKEIIVYCYSTPCMTGRKIGKLLTDNKIYVKHLGIGWNEWRYYWDLWNHDSETPTKMEDYIISGKKPGSPKIKELPTPCGEGDLGC